MSNPQHTQRSSSRVKNALKSKQKRNLEPDPQEPPRKIADRRSSTSSDKENVKKDQSKSSSSKRAGSSGKEQGKEQEKEQKKSTPPPKKAPQDPKVKAKRRAQDKKNSASRDAETPQSSSRNQPSTFPTPPDSSGSNSPPTTSSDVSALSSSFGNIRIKFDKLPEEWIEEGWWKPKAKKDHVAVFHRPSATLARRVITLEPHRVQSPHDYIQLMHVIQSFVYQLNQLPTNQFEELVEKVNGIVEIMQEENKSRALSLHIIHMDYHLYHTFSSMIPNDLCDEEAVYTHHFFKMFRNSVEEHYQNDEQTKEHMLEIVDINLGSLRQYGDKMVIPCAKIVERFEAFVEQILNESREK